jgi:peptidoglycan/LPS O-acetylase OafA/YrhL
VNKPVVGIVFGAVLGVLDGLTAWFTPEARPFLTSILIGSCLKGMVVGALSGVFARKVKSDRAGVAVGAVLGLAFAFAVAAMPSETGQHYYMQIMLPGFVVGAIIGFLTQRVGTGPELPEKRAGGL